MAVSTSFCPPPLTAPRAAVHDSHLNTAVPFPLTTRTKPQPLLRSNHAPPPLHIVCGRNPRAAVVTVDSWENSIVKSDIPVLVEFYASWCGPCRMVHRVIDEIAGEYDGKLKCFVLNTDTDLEIAEEYEIKAVPVVMLFKNGEKCETVVGTMPKEFYVAAVERIIQ